MAKQVHLIVSGRVQGVFYRKSAQVEANRLAISGYAKNLPDGSVEIIAVGGEVELRQFIGWCQKGPRGAAVQDVKMEEGEAQDHFKRFEIL